MNTVRPVERSMVTDRFVETSRLLSVVHKLKLLRTRALNVICIRHKSISQLNIRKSLVSHIY